MFFFSHFQHSGFDLVLDSPMSTITNTPTSTSNSPMSTITNTPTSASNSPMSTISSWPDASSSEFEQKELD
jgi:hypothetical protein